MISTKDPTKYRKVFEFPVTKMSFDHHRKNRRYRYNWSNPGGHKPYVVEYWPEFWEPDDLDAFYFKASQEPYPVGSLFIKWRDNVGDFVTQEFLLYVEYRKAVNAKTKVPLDLISRGTHWSVACTGIRDMTKGELCGVRTNKIAMTYDKVSWGCRWCLQKQQMIFEYSLTEAEPDNEWWYDKILGIDDGVNIPPRETREIGVDIDGTWFDQ